MNTIKLNTIGTPKVSGGNSGGGGSASGYAPVLVGIPPDSGNFEEWGCIDFNAKKVWYFDSESYEVKEDTESVFDGNTLRLSLNGVKALTQIYGPAGIIHLTARMSRVFINTAMDLIHEDGSVESGPMDSPSGVFQSLIFTGDLGNKCYINSELDGSQYVIECNHSYEDVRNIL